MQNPEHHEPYTIEDLLREYGDDTDQAAHEDPRDPAPTYELVEHYPQDDWPEPGSLLPKPTATSDMRARLHHAHIRLAFHAGQTADRCGDEPHKRMGCVARLAEYNATLRQATAYLFDSPTAPQQVKAEIGAALREQRNELNAQESELMHWVAVLDDPDEMSEMTAGYSHAVAIRATAETMREMQEEARHQTGGARTSSQAALVELYHHAHKNYRCIARETHCSISHTWDTPTASALNECEQIYRETLQEFNRSLIATSYSRSLANRGAAIDPKIGQSGLEPEGVITGIATPAHRAVRFLPCPRRREAIPYVVFRHQGARRIQAVDDPFPHDIAQSTVLQLLSTCREQLWRVETDESTLQQALAKTERAIEDAEAGIGNVSCYDRQAFAKWTRSIGMTAGATADLIDAVVDDSDAADRFLDDAGVNGRIVPKRAASRIVNSARRNGLDENQLERLADSMGWPHAEDLGIKPYRPNPDQAALTARMAHDLGFHETAAARIRDTMERWAQGARPRRWAWWITRK